jgi:hypothetical protein
MKKIVLYDVDSTIPNLALMKLGTYHKALGDEVTLVKTPVLWDKFDYGYASVIFTKNKSKVEDFPWEIGGTGADLSTTLPNEVEHSMPDYTLFPENNYSIGFCTRGCVRKCSFCFVPKKEGTLKFNAHIEEFHDKKNKKIMLLDNNILAYSNYKEVFAEIRSVNRPTCFKQGMDFRLLTEDKVKELLSIKYDKEYIFAYDSIQIRDSIEKNMLLYRKYFTDWKLKFFVLVGYDSTIEEDVFRIRYLRGLKILPYVMRHERCYNSQYKDFYTDIASWCNQVAIFKKLNFYDFLLRRTKNKERINRSFRLYKYFR